MAKKMNGLFRDLIVHPGQSLQDYLQENSITQRDFSVRVGVSAKHISTIVNGKADITSELARKFEIATGIPAAFWINLQANYDLQLAEYEARQAVTDDEIAIARKLEKIYKYTVEQGLLPPYLKAEALVLALHKFLAVNSLMAVPNLGMNSLFRASARGADPYILTTWLKVCEALAAREDVSSQLDVERLTKSIPIIKELMFEKDPNQMQRELKKVFAECGIRFCIVKHFTGAPVQGFIHLNSDGTLTLCLTLRQKFADVFWFTLFHEIGHIVLGHATNRFIDVKDENSPSEQIADDFAADCLIDSDRFEAFAMRFSFPIEDIKLFAKEESVLPSIVIGRLCHKGLMQWKDVSHWRDHFDWE